MQQTSALRVVWDEPDETSTDGLSSSITLGEFFSRYAWPDCLAPKGDTGRTLRDYQRSLSYWSTLTGDPPLAEIDQRTCSLFLRRLSGLTPDELRQMRCGGGGPPTAVGGSGRLSPNTVRKHWQNLQRLLCWTGPASRQTPEGAGLIAVPPWAPMPRPDRPGPRPAASLDWLWRWLDVLPTRARPMPKIKGHDPAAWWRALLVTAYNTGLRPGALMRIEWQMLDGHRLRLPPSIAKGGRGYLLWINTPALAALEPLRRLSGLVFGWAGWPAGETTLKKHRIRQQRGAGIPPMSLYSLRRMFATEAARINPLAAQLQMGHRGLGMAMMIDHYLDHEATLRDALERLPQPGRAVQQKLF